MKLKEKTKRWIKIGVALFTFIAITVAIFITLNHYGVTSVASLQDLISRTHAWAPVVFIILYMFVNILFCFVPSTSAAMITVAVIIFENKLEAFLLCLTAVTLTSVVMDIIGRFGGVKAIKWLVGEEEYNEAKDLIKEKGMVYVPVMYLLPVFPDDAICMLTGAAKVNFGIHLLEIIICRGIGTATLVFGVKLLPEELITNITQGNWAAVELFDCLVVVTVILFWIIVLLYLARKIDKLLTKKIKEKKDEQRRISSKSIRGDEDIR